VLAGALSLLALEVACFSSCLLFCLLVGWPVVPTPEDDFDPLPIELLSSFVRLEEFASAAWNVMPDGLAETGIGKVAVPGVVDGEAIRTHALVHVLCQYLPFSAPTVKLSRN
jgi:hypothetical protein